ncbi:MAG: hypothetical protein V2I43_12470 [Parvularcula sp.]|nr:hypothetical protein [Parvularcula sp.]
MPSLPGMPKQAENERHREREALAHAVNRFDRQPWDATDDPEDAGLVGMIFGRGGPSPKRDAEVYLVRVGAEDSASQVRRDLEQSLNAAWHVAATGREATYAIEPIPEDLRMIEEAIVEARRCRMVYTEALTMIAKRDGSIDRDEIRAIKDEFNEAILELGRTADVMSQRLSRKPAQSLARTDV